MHIERAPGTDELHRFGLLGSIHEDDIQPQVRCWVSRRISERFGQVPVNRLWTWARLCVLEFDSTLPEFRVRLAVHGGNRFIGNLGRHRLLRGRRAGRLTCGATRVGH